MRFVKAMVLHKILSSFMFAVTFNTAVFKNKKVRISEILYNSLIYTTTY